MELKNRSVRVDDSWMAHLEDQAKQLSETLGRNVKMYEVMGAAIMAFRPAEVAAHRKAVEDLSGEIQNRKFADKVAGMSAREKEQLAEMLGVPVEKLKRLKK